MPKVKRNLKFLHLRVNKVEDYQVHVDSDLTKAVIFSNLLESIKYGVEENKKEVELFLVDEGKCVVSLPRDKWKSTLKTALKYYSAKSEYEKCIDCQELINLVVSK